MSGHPAGTKDYWHQKYLHQNTPWDLGGPHPAMPALLDEINKLTNNATLNVYVPGMGNGHDAAFFAQNGHNTTGGDLSDKAVANAKAEYQNMSHLSFQVLDAIKDPTPRNLDLVFDRAMLCALPASKQLLYLESCKKKLSHKGLFASILFTKVANETGPPWAMSEQELALKLKPLGFHLVYAKDNTVTYESSFVLQESIVIFSKT